MKIELEDSDISRIADAVVAKIVAAGGTVETAPAAEEKAPAKAKAEAKPKAKAEKAAAPTTDRNEVLAKVKELGEAKGRDVAKGIISNYAESFGAVKDEDLADLLASVTAALEGDDDSADADEGDGY